MAINESGHAINVANFRVLIDHCKELGVAYAPAHAELSVVQLEALHQAARQALDQLTTTAMATRQSLNERETTFASLGKLVTRVLAAYKSGPASDAAIADARAQANKVRGIGLNPLMDKEGNPDPKHVSNSQQSYVQRVEAFRRLIELLTSGGTYGPTERELTLAALRTQLASLEAANEAVGGVLAAATNARNQRTTLLYGTDTGILDLAVKVKQYCKSIAPANQLLVKKIQGISFRRLRS